jgi:hypothetical protein
MPVNAVTSSAATPVQPVVNQGKPSGKTAPAGRSEGPEAQAAPSAAALASQAAIQEANETAATTIKEAASGDKQAMRLLAKQQANTANTAPTPQSREAGTVSHLA